jgi:hypothetical protein
MGPRWPGSACNSFAFLMRSKIRVGAEVAGSAVITCPVHGHTGNSPQCKSDGYSRPWRCPRTRQKLSEAILHVEVFHTAPTRLASILDGLGHQTSQQGG